MRCETFFDKHPHHGRHGASALVGAFALLLSCLAGVVNAPSATADSDIWVEFGSTSTRIHDVTAERAPGDTWYANTYYCVRYNPSPGGSTANATTTTTVASGSYALFSYGSESPYSCPSGFSYTTQSSVGFMPGDTSAVNVGEVFLVGTMRHHNSPIYTGIGTGTGGGGTRMNGTMDIDLASTLQASFPFELNETVNTCRSTFDAQGNYDATGSGAYAFNRYGDIGLRATWSGWGWSSDYHYAFDRNDTLRSFPPGDTSADGSNEGALYGRDGRSCEDDVLSMTSHSSTTTWTDPSTGIAYKLVLRGFVNNGRNTVCSTDASSVESRLEDTFITQENTDTYGCLYGSLEQVRTVTFAKDVTGSSGDAVAIPQFTYTNVSQADSMELERWGTPNPLQPTGWGSDHAATDSRSYELFVPNGGGAVQENQADPAPTEETPGWRLSGVTCTQSDGAPLLDEDGNVLDQTGAVDLETGTLDLSTVGLAQTAAEMAITCTWHNEYVEPAPQLRVEKAFTGSDAVAGTPTFNADYTITVTNDGVTTQNSGVLVDRPDFAAGANLNTVWISQDPAELGQDGAVVEDSGDGSYRITEGVVLEPGQSQVFYVRANVTLDPSTPGYSVQDLVCSQTESGYEARHGLFNEVIAEDGKDVDGPENNTACGPVDPDAARRQVTIHKTGIQGSVSGATFAIYPVDPSTEGATPLDEGVTVDPDDGSVFTTAALDLNRDYWLVETQAPAGHERLPGPIGFHLTADGVTLLDPDALAGTVTVSRTDQGVDVITVNDTAVAVPLPLTGGHGALLYGLAAIVLLGTAGALAIRHRRSHHGVQASG
ncbi:Gram-positive cocci surface proteins LPxTG motif profile [Propionibacterium ruminifibrarum]|uniref:Gram-positive cocci surface proteins LPxTG motif profile n=1 Tax=Propionibacterium ruminifibrarum TaxID=1962131 RepID=A0A375I5G5_9ACTN|nr:Gram-positive cocci surface proteins LPxTG motif profile [Propionibacterium ruminifibrarum]